MSTVLVLSIHEIISPENYKFFKGVVPMDKITHQVRAEHWAKIMNGKTGMPVRATVCTVPFRKPGMGR